MLALCAESILFQKKSKADGRIAQLSDDIAALHTEIGKAKSAKVILYESYKKGKLTKDMYLDERNGNDEAVAKATKEIERISRGMEALRGELCDNQFVDSLKNFRDIFELTPKLVHELVAAIKIHDIDTIEIMWNFEDDYQRVLQMLGSFVAKV